MRSKFKNLTFLSFSASTLLFAGNLTVYPNWNLFGDSIEIDLNKTFNKYSDIKIIWSFNNLTQEWNPYGNSETYLEKIAKTNYQSANKIGARNGFWVFNDSNNTFTIEINPETNISNGTNSTIENNISSSARKFLNVPRTFTRDDTNNIVTESTFGLKWEDTNHSKDTTMNYNDADSYCENLELGGITDWRVPTQKELWFLHDRNLSNPALSSTFKNVANDSYANDTYWSNQAVSGYESYNWSVYSSSGFDDWKTRTSNYYVRCVSGESHYEDINFSRDSSKNVVIDNTNNLMWQDSSGDVLRTWSEAISYCENLDFAGYSDWRLATIEELYSITDQRKNSTPSVNQSFQNISSNFYWSSTITKNYTSYSWLLYFYYGWLLQQSGRLYLFRCLRNNQ